MSEKYLSLGLEDRDRVNESFGGGIPTGSLMYLEGPDGAGKSAISQRIAYGLCEEGFDVTYVSTELDSEKFLEQMYSLSYDVTDHLLGDDGLLFLNADIDTHRQVGGKAEGERELLSKLYNDGPMWQSDVIILDEFSSMLRNDPNFDASAEHGDEDHAMQSLLNLFNQITKQGKIIVVTAAPESVSERALTPLRDASDIYFDIQTQQVGSEIRHNIAVRRYLGMGGQVDDTIGFAVQQGRGLVIESRTVA